jgi:hypothetical protein
VDALARRIDPRLAAALSGSASTEQIQTLWMLVREPLTARRRELADAERRASGREASVMERVGSRIEPSLAAVEALLFSYFRFRQALAVAGWRPVEPTIGLSKAPRDVDPEQHDTQGALDAHRYAVRTLGLKVKGRTIARAVVAPDNGGTP